MDRSFMKVAPFDYMLILEFYSMEIVHNCCSRYFNNSGKLFNCEWECNFIAYCFNILDKKQ